MESNRIDSSRKSWSDWLDLLALITAESLQLTAWCVFTCWKVWKTFSRAEQHTSGQQCVFDHQRLFEVVIVMSTFFMFKRIRKILQVLNSSCSAGLYALRHRINSGDNWLLHSAVGPFDLLLLGHVMKEIFIGAELCSDQTLILAKLRYGFPCVIFISSRYLKGAQFTDATSVPLQTFFFIGWQGLWNDSLAMWRARPCTESSPTLLLYVAF